MNFNIDMSMENKDIKTENISDNGDSNFIYEQDKVNTLKENDDKLRWVMLTKSVMLLKFLSVLVKHGSKLHFYTPSPIFQLNHYIWLQLNKVWEIINRYLFKQFNCLYNFISIISKSTPKV